MAFLPYTDFSEQELLSITDKLNLQSARWIEEQFVSGAPIATLIVQPPQPKESLALAWDPLDLDAKGAAIYNIDSSCIRVTAVAQEWLTLLGLPTNTVKKSALKPAEITLLLAALAESFSQAIIESNAITSSPSVLTSNELIQFSKVKGSGVLLLSLKLRGLVIEALVYGGIFKERKASNNKPALPRKKLENRAASCTDISLDLKATLGFTELSVGDVGQISIGDIIKFDQSVSEPIKLFNSNGEFVCHGSLGKQDQNKALLLSK